MKKKFDRFIATNYWDCPILDYSVIYSTDYSNAKSRCGNKISLKKFFFKKKKKMKRQKNKKNKKNKKKQKKTKKNKKKQKNRFKLFSRSMFKWRTMLNKIEWKLSL